MQEKTLLKIAVLTALLGVGFLALYASELEIGAVERLDTALPEETIELQGIITRLNQRDKVTFVELQGQRIETADVVIFTEENLYLQQGDYVEIVGTVEDYQGKREVIASKVVKR